MTRWTSVDRARLWQVGGVATVVVILVASWLLLLQPKRADVVASQTAADAARSEQAVELNTLRALRADFLKFDEYRNRLAANRQALPGTDALPAFLRELQAAGEATGVAVTQVGVGNPTAIDASGAVVEPGATAASDTTMYAIVVTLQATGDADTDADFLYQLQQLQPRAVLFDTLTLAAAADDAGGAGAVVTLDASLRVFVDTASAAPVPR